MKRFRVVVTKAADEDLDDIFEYIAQDDVETAEAFIQDLTAKTHHLAEIGLTGFPRDWIAPNLRAFPYKERCFYFEIEGDKLLLLRVLSSYQDIEQQDFQRG